ncbi:MAG TPA: ribonuclease Y [Candidatus Sulfomarinibacteraceae bacterium]|nr:ribonuclease Y [Candidatus Sulfomarinibacteraceae bacterium]
MELVIGIIIGLLVGGAIAGGIAYYVQRPRTEQIYADARDEAAQTKQKAEQEAQAEVEAARKEAKQLRIEAEKAVERRYEDLSRAEERLDRRQSTLDKQQSKIERREQRLNKRQSRLDRRQNELSELEKARNEELQKIAGLTEEEAKQLLLDAVESEARQDMARIMREIEDEAREMGEERARELISLAIQRVASEHVSDVTISVVSLPSDDMKGRIIGRNGRNIRAFEMAAGVDVVVDDTPEAVTISSFDPTRREVARRAMTKLVSDGRIHPARIEKLIKEQEDEVDRVVKTAGEEAAYEANVHGLHPEILKMLGRLKFRTSYGQNQLHHAVEAAKIAAVLASELGGDVETAKMGALLHDLGKAMDHEQEGTHALLGAEFVKRFNVPPKVVNAVASHHHEVDQESVEAILVEAADAISGARPGARRESLENYIKRVRTLEDIAASFDGVETAYALQAGREIRILVKPDSIDDLGAMRLSKEISKTIEDSMQYPGQIQVTVIRETRSIGFAK